MKPTANRRLKIAVLCGGDSPEREVSIKSGARISNALRRRGYLVAVIDPSSEYLDRDIRFTSRATRSCRCERRAKRRAASYKHGKSRGFTASALSFCQKSDVVFMALHGGAGEDGRIAAVLECMGIPHTGSDHKGLCLSMDKALSKRLMSEAGIPTPEYVHLPRSSSNHGDLPRETPIPCVVKPIYGGSSIGVRMAEDKGELERILTDRRSLRDELIIEKRIVGREFTVGILNGEALAVTELIPRKGFYDYKNKYTKGATEEITPANIDSELENAVKNTALHTHKALCLGAYSRIDIIVENETNQIYVLEANALPGMTETSLLPQGAAAVGIDFDTLCERMLKSAQ